MALTDAEIEATRFHLGYGNLDFGSYPYTADGFKSLFAQVIGPNITIGAETTAPTTAAAGASTAITPVSMTGIAAQVRLSVDVGDQNELVVVAATTISTFTAFFSLAHSGGYPVCVESGTTRLRQLLHQADKAWQAMLSQTVGATAGIKKVDEVEFFQGFAVMTGRLAQYKAIVHSIASLTRVPPQWEAEGGGCGRTQLEAY